MSRSGWTAVWAAVAATVGGAGALGQVQSDDHPDQEAALFGEASAALNVPSEYDPSQFSRLSPAAPVALQLQEWNIESGLFALRWDSAGDSGSYPIVYRVRVWRYCPADLAGPGAAPHPDGVADANDIIYFIDRFFAGDPVADIGGAGGTPRPDGQFNNNDLVVYIDRFFAGCP